MAFTFAGENLYSSSSNYILRGSRNGAPQQDRYQNTLVRCSSLEINEKTNGSSAGGGCNIQSVGGGSAANAPVLPADHVETTRGNEGHPIDKTNIDPQEMKRLKRKAQNKISAEKSRLKKKQDLEEAEKKIKDLQEEKSRLTDQILFLTDRTSVLSGEVSRVTDEAVRWRKLALQVNHEALTDGFSMAYTPPCQLCDCFGHTAKNCPQHLVFPYGQEDNVVPNAPTTATSGSPTDPNWCDNSTSEASSYIVDQQCLTDEEDELRILLQQPTTEEELIRRCSLY